jgi:MoaA/NifB/PqqE/SkfB family radical SAM enzyme
MGPSTFVLSESLILRDEPQYFESYIVLDYNKNVHWQVDLSSLRILESLEQKPLCAQCISQMINESDADYTLEHMVGLGWLVGNEASVCDHHWELNLQKLQNWIQVLPPEKRRVAILTAPTQATVVITQRCDLACVHCNVSATSLKGPELITLETWTTVLDDLERLKIFKVVLSGGEPFVYQDFDRLLEHFARKRYLKSILTNGTHITKEHAELMKHHRISPTLSLDGGNAETHDAFRRVPGAFAALLRTLGYLRDIDIPFNIVSVVHKRSAGEIRSIAEIAYKYFAGALYFVPLKALGRGRSAQAWTEGMKTYLEVREEVDRIAPEFPGMSISFDEELDEEEFGPTQDKTRFHDTPCGYTTCMAGKNGLVVDDDGKVYGCMLGMQMKVHPVGSILENSIEEIWRNGDWGIYREPLEHGCRANILYKVEKQKPKPHHINTLPVSTTGGQIS